MRKLTRTAATQMLLPVAAVFNKAELEMVLMRNQPKKVSNVYDDENNIQCEPRPRTARSTTARSMRSQRGTPWPLSCQL